MNFKGLCKNLPFILTEKQKNRIKRSLDLVLWVLCEQLLFVFLYAFTIFLAYLYFKFAGDIFSLVPDYPTRYTIIDYGKWEAWLLSMILSGELMQLLFSLYRTFSLGFIFFFIYFCIVHPDDNRVRSRYLFLIVKRTAALLCITVMSFRHTYISIRFAAVIFFAFLAVKILSSVIIRRLCINTGNS